MRDVTNATSEQRTVNPTAYAEENRDREVFLRLKDESAKGVIAGIALCKEFYVAVRADRTMLVESGAGQAISARRGDVLLFDTERTIAGMTVHSIDHPGGLEQWLTENPGWVGDMARRDFLAILKPQDQAHFDRIDSAMLPIVGLDASARAQFVELKKQLLPVREHLNDLAVMAPYARESVEKLLAMPASFGMAKAIEFANLRAARAGEER